MESNTRLMETARDWFCGPVTRFPLPQEEISRSHSLPVYRWYFMQLLAFGGFFPKQQ